MKIKKTINISYSPEEQKAVNLVNDLILDICNEWGNCEYCPLHSFCDEWDADKENIIDTILIKMTRSER